MKKETILKKRARGKIEIKGKLPVETKNDLSVAYTPGVAEVSKAIAKAPNKAFKYTMKGNTIAIVTDGSAVLDLGNIGAEAALPVMEGKSLLLKRFAGVDAFPICIRTQDPKEIIKLVRNIAPGFGGINLEDISAPRCFEIEQALQDLGIPVFHDDQHGTAIVVLAGIINAAKVVKKPFSSLKIVVNGTGAAGTAITKLFAHIGGKRRVCQTVRDLIVCDSRGIISRGRTHLSPHKKKLARVTNKYNLLGTLADALKGADVFIGVSKGSMVTEKMVRSMNKDPIIFALANPTPEIPPDKAKKAGAKVIATGRSDYPNQVNNALAFPGIFRGALDARLKRITPDMHIEAAEAIASCVKKVTPRNIIPSIFDPKVARKVAKAMSK